jgi:hypothetical protein
MPTLIDELVVKLKLDGAAFAGQAQQTRSALSQVGGTARREAASLEDYLKRTQAETGRRMQQTAEVGRQISQQFSNVKNNVLGFLGVIAGAYGLQQFTSNIIHADAALGNFASSLGIDPAIIATWQEMGKRVGASVDSVRSAFVAYNKIKTDIQLHGTSAAIPQLRSIGVNLYDEKGNLKEAPEFFKSISEAVKTHPAGLVRAALEGIMPPDMIPLMMKGRDELTQMETALRALGVASAESAKKSQDFLNTLADLQQRLIDIGREALGPLLPVLGGLVTQLGQWGDKNKELISSSVVSVVKETINVMKELAAAIAPVVEGLGGWKVAAEIVLGVWAANKVLPILSFVLRLGGLLVGANAGITALGEGMAVFTARALPGLLAGLGPIGAAIGAITTAMALLNKSFDPAEFPENSPFWHGMSPEEQLKYPNSPESIKRNGRPGGGSGSWLWDKMRGIFGGGNTFTPTADLAMPPERRAFLDTLSLGESGGDYRAQNPTSTAHGRYQFIDSTDREVSGQTGLTGQDPISQDRKAWFLASRTYAANTGRDLGADLKAGGREAQIATALKSVWPSLPGGSQQNTSMAQYLTRMRDSTAGYGAQGAPSVPPVGPAFGPQLPPPAAAAGMVSTNNSRTSSVETHVNGPITVQTSATDAEGVAKGLGAALRKYAYVPQMNVGLA